MKHVTLLKNLKILLGIATALLLSYNFYVANNLLCRTDGDAANFVELGVSLAKHQKYGHLDTNEGIIDAFSNNAIVHEEPQFSGHSTWRPPVWPFIIAGVFLIFGYNLTYLLLFKFLLHIIGCWFFYKTLKLLKLKEVLIILGVFIYAVNPAWELYSRVLLSEPITFFVITLWIYFLIRFLSNKSSFLPQGIMSGILILSHPYYLFLPFSVWFFLFIKRHISIKHFILSSLLCTSLVSVWVIRNFIVLRTSEIVLTTSSGAVMAKGWNKEVPENHTNTKGDLADETLVLKSFDYQKDKVRGEVERMKLHKDASIQFIKTHPKLIVPIIGTKLSSAFNPFPETPRPGILETGRVIFQVLALLAIVYILFFSRSRLAISLSLGLILSTVVISILTYSGFRFRMPQVAIELLLILFAVNDILNLKFRKKIENHISEKPIKFFF